MENTDNMEAETRLLALLSNEESELKVIDPYGCAVRFKRPSMAKKHQGRAWAFRKMKEYGYDPNDDHSGTSILQYWGQLNAYVSTVLVRSADDTWEAYGYDKVKDADYSCVFEKFVVEEIYNRRGLLEDDFVAEVIIAMMRWISETSVSDEEVKNS